MLLGQGSAGVEGELESERRMEIYRVMESSVSAVRWDYRRDGGRDQGPGPRVMMPGEEGKREGMGRGSWVEAVEEWFEDVPQKVLSALLWPGLAWPSVPSSSRLSISGLDLVLDL